MQHVVPDGSKKGVKKDLHELYRKIQPEFYPYRKF
jgi:hypothetical protein